MTEPKKLLAFFFLLLPFASSVNAEEEERDFKRELFTSIGAKAEKMTEKVYSNGNMTSELVWADTVDAVFDVSLDLNFCGAFADLAFSAGVPLKIRNTRGFGLFRRKQDSFFRAFNRHRQELRSIGKMRL